MFFAVFKSLAVPAQRSAPLTTSHPLTLQALLASGKTTLSVVILESSYFSVHLEEGIEQVYR